MASEYIIPPVPNDPEAFRQDAFDYIAARVDGWEPSPGHEATLIIEAWSEQQAIQADIASGVLTSAFRYFGGLAGVPPIDAIPAQGVVTITVPVSAADQTVAAGAVFGLRDTDGTLQGFDLQDDVTIVAGGTTGTGTVIAETAGEIGNGLSGAAQLISVPAFVSSASIAATANGLEAEDDSVYLNRLTETLTLLSPRPILPKDFSILARSVAGVFRATGVDGLKPGAPYSGTAEATSQPATMTVAVADSAGQPVGSTIRGEVTNLLQSEREQSFDVYVVDPQYTAIDVTATAQAWPGFDATALQAAIKTALESYLSPATWGTDTSGNTESWQNDPTLRVGELYAVVSAVQGVRYVTSLTFGIHGGSLATTNVTLGAGSAIPALPTTASGNLSITVLPG